MELFNLFKNSAYLIISRIVKFSTGLINAKIVAIFLGTYGAGILSQVNQITLSMYMITLLTMNSGLIKGIAEGDKHNKDFNQQLSTLLKTYIFIITVILIASMFIFLCYSEKLTVFVFGDVKYYGYYLIAVISFPIFIINSISAAILRGYKLIKIIARSEIIVIVINLFAFVPLVYIWGIDGACVFIPFSLVTMLLVNNFYARKYVLKPAQISGSRILKASINPKIVNGLMFYAGYGIISGIAGISSETICRGIVVNSLGIDKIGLYSPVLNWGSLFTGFITPSIFTYLYPRFSESKDNSELCEIINDSIRFVTLLMIPFLLISIPLRYQLIPLFYSSEFISSGNYLPWHLLGIYFFICTNIFIQAMTAKGKLKICAFVVVGMSIIDIAIVYNFVNYYGLYGWMLKYIVSPVIFMLYMIQYSKIKLNFNLESKNNYLIGYLVLSFIIILLLDFYTNLIDTTILIISVILLCFSYLMLSIAEKKFINNNVKKLFKVLSISSV